MKDPELLQYFYSQIKIFFNELNFHIISTCINKESYNETMCKRFGDPYVCSLDFVLERCIKFSNKNSNCEIIPIAESRGSKEDNMLQAAYTQTINNGTRYCKSNQFLKLLPEKIEFRRKNENILGLQLADLVAMPISNKVLKPKEKNVPFEIIENKFDRNWIGSIWGCGLKIFP